MSTSTSVAEVGLPAGSAPAVDTGHALSVRGRTQTTAGVTLRMLLFQGATQITASALETDALTTQIASYVLPITSGDVAGIASYSGLSVKFWAFSAAGDTPVVEVEEVFLSLPAAGVGVAHFDRPSGNLTLAGAVAEFHIVAAAPADTPVGRLVFSGRAVEHRLPPIVHVDAPAGTLTLAGSVVEFNIAASAPSDTPVGKLVLAGRAAEAWANRTARAGTITLASGGTVSQPVAPSVVDQAPGLIRTAMPGTPGLVQPGYFCTGVAVWHGPFATEISLGITARERLTGGQQLTVAPNVASQFAAADATWWEFH